MLTRRPSERPSADDNHPPTRRGHWLANSQSSSASQPDGDEAVSTVTRYGRTERLSTVTVTAPSGEKGYARSVRFELPLRVVSEANARGHWAKAARRAKKTREAVALAWRCHARGVKLAPPVTVWLTRLGPRPMDSDNNVRALKAVRDEVAAQLDVDDGDPRITWEYSQAGSGKRGVYGVQVYVEERRS